MGNDRADAVNRQTSHNDAQREQNSESGPDFPVNGHVPEHDDDPFLPPGVNKMNGNCAKDQKETRVKDFVISKLANYMPRQIKVDFLWNVIRKYDSLLETVNLGG